jgi:hypothetical protein
MGAEVEPVLRFEPFLGVVLSKPVRERNIRMSVNDVDVNCIAGKKSTNISTKSLNTERRSIYKQKKMSPPSLRRPRVAN